MLSPLKLLVLAGMAGYLGGAVARRLGARRLALGWAGIGAAANLAAIAWRGLAVGRWPLASMGEALCALGPACFIFYLLAEREGDDGAGWLDLLIGAVLAQLPAVILLKEPAGRLMPALASPFFFPHVTAYLVGYAALVKAGLLAGGLWLAGPTPDGRQSALAATADRAVRHGYPFLTVGLLLGALWGKYAWGNYWGWDPKELWGLVTWLIYTAYLHLPAAGIRKGPVVRALFLVAGVASIVTTVVVVSWLLSGVHSYG